jgi:hypothetical protein
MDLMWPSTINDKWDHIIEKLRDFENMTWQGIKQQTHDYDGKSSSHRIAIDDFSKEAITRYNEIFHEQNRQNFLFSLRLTNKERLFGVLEEGVFSIVWYDANHIVCPSLK